jgi:flagellar motor switch protein FliG
MERDFIRQTGDGRVAPRKSKGGGAGRPPDAGAARTARDASRDSGYHKAAQVLILIGEDLAARVLRHLTEEEVEGITREIATITRISDVDALKVLEEFGYLARAGRGTPVGGVERARELLEATLGKEKGGALLERVRTRLGPSFRFMRTVDPHQAAALLREESNSVAAAVLTQIDAGQAARILACFGPGDQREIALRVARMSRLSPDVMEKVRASLEGRLNAEGLIVTRGVDGQATLLAIARTMDAESQAALLEGLEADDPHLAAQVETRLFGVEAAVQLPRRELGRILAGLSDREVALLTGGTGPTAREALLSAVSDRRRAIIASEEELSGAPTPAESARAAREFAAHVRKARREGRGVPGGHPEELA